ncbi:SGNH/GDSL hydrolase family protein [Mucilaginibacter polytrichastri]|uniref:SGNH hydrolase-type esterase domain-containing protein n=1 Tax=Mucilaginibacter polytrichastri TaxID=1302689 RepID=A0A1Q6A6A9_9SPHI|nr:GDSL-type esterase/lipase family protein [Mucilaginibacter polytrichastri]OKS89545.1 hypothetical protein RG47T_5029 [Mucilaginibacter polytrichastri]SFS70515.1 Lysophospholipase L1 [Mucilaginibacter polytrichastri]
MKKYSFLFFLFTIVVDTGATGQSLAPHKNINDSLTYIALGDSYTTGRAVSTDQSFPYQLAALLKHKNLKVAAPVLIAQNGWRTDELLKGISNSDTSKTVDFVTLLIGVNNQFQHYGIAVYQTEFTLLLKRAVKFTGGNARHVFVLSIPDWGVTPYANGRNRDKIAEEIDQYNAINKDASEKAGANYINLTDLSRAMADDESYIAGDKLHPSGKMYSLWAQKLAAAINKQFKK